MLDQTLLIEETVSNVSVFRGDEVRKYPKELLTYLKAQQLIIFIFRLEILNVEHLL